VSGGALVGAFLVVLFASGMQSLTGFGFSLLAMPLLSLVIDPKEAVVVAFVLGLTTSSVMFARTRHAVDQPVAGRMLLAAVLGMPFGLAVLVFVDDQVLRAILAVTVLVFVGLLAAGFRLHGRGHGVDWGAGFTSGVLNTSLSTNGPPLVIALQAREPTPEVFVATLSAVFVGSGVIGLVMLLVAGRVDSDVLVTIVVTFPALLVGTIVGQRLRPRVPPARFRALVLLLLTVSAVAALVGVLFD
jgi:uncharacterized membrane protein YfcA